MKPTRPSRRAGLRAVAFIAFVLCLSIATGTVYALFSHDTDLGAKVSAGKVEIAATIGTPTLYSPAAIGKDGQVADPTNIATATRFANGGTASTDGQLLILDNLTPGDRATFPVALVNHSTVAIKYQVTLLAVNAPSSTLVDVLHITINGQKTQADGLSDWIPVAPGAPLKSETLTVAIELPPDATDTYMGQSAALAIQVKAVQGNAVVRDGLEVATDGGWDIYGARGLREFQESVNAGATYTGETVRLRVNVDLDGENWTPIGTATTPFCGTFDGLGHTVANLTATAPAGTGDGIGLFGHIGDGAAITDLTVHNATVDGDTGVSPLVGAVADEATVTLSDLTLSGKVAIEAAGGAGGLVGNAATATITARRLTVAVTPDSLATTTRNSGGCDALGGVFGQVGDGQFRDITCDLSVTGQAYGIGGVAGCAGGDWQGVTATGDVTVLTQNTGVWYQNTLPTGNAYGDICFWQGNGRLIGTHATIRLTDCAATGTLSILTPDGTALDSNALYFFTAGGDRVTDSLLGCSHRFNDNTVTLG